MTRAEPRTCLARSFGAMGLAALIVWAGLTAWALSGETLEQRLLQPIELVPEIDAWRISVGVGEFDADGLRLLEPGPLADALVIIELPTVVDASRIASVEIHAADRLPDSLQFGWSTSPIFNIASSVAVPRFEDSTGVVEVENDSAWQGKTYFLSLEQAGFISGPWTLQSLVLQPRVPGFVELQRMFLASFSPSESWMQRSPHRILPFDAGLHLSPVPLIALWALLSAGLMLAFGIGRTPAWLLLPLILGWLILDVRWQIELAGKALDTHSNFAAVPAEERFSRDIDGGLFVFLRALEQSHERQEFQRVFAFSDSEFLRKRARYHLASWAVREAPSSVLTPEVSAQFRSGDLLLLLETAELQFAISGDRVDVSRPDGRILITGQLVSREHEWIAIKVQ